jgi:hypothetical protein
MPASVAAAANAFLALLAAFAFLAASSALRTALRAARPSCGEILRFDDWHGHGCNHPPKVIPGGSAYYALTGAAEPPPKIV